MTSRKWSEVRRERTTNPAVTALDDAATWANGARNRLRSGSPDVESALNLAIANIGKAQKALAAANPAPTADRTALLMELESLRDSGYQPGYNGRPSCPFCANFIDSEETHTPTCPLPRIIRALAATPAPESPTRPIRGRGTGGATRTGRTVTPPPRQWADS